jgi:hypothetical protein
MSGQQLLRNPDIEPTDEIIAKGLPLGIYRHYKGNQYEVVGFVKHSETLEDMVVYKALYGDCGIWVRPLAMWENPIEVDGKTVKRFEYTGEADRQHNLNEALRAINSTISKCEKAYTKLTEGTPQHTLMKRRLEAFYIAVSLIEKERRSYGECFIKRR